MVVVARFEVVVALPCRLCGGGVGAGGGGCGAALRFDGRALDLAAACLQRVSISDRSATFSAAAVASFS